MGQQELVELFSPLGDAGLEALRDLCRKLPEPSMAAAALEALFQLDPSAAASIAEARLAESLAKDCVPGAIVKLLHQRKLDPFPPLLERLRALSCERKSLRPDGPILGTDDKEPELRARAAELAGQASGPCREALELLFGLR
jgi:hypothetical protein